MKAADLYKKLFLVGTNPIIIITAIFTALAVISFGFEDFSLKFDEAYWTYMGHVWFKNGLAPYVGALDNKPPGIYLLYGISDWLFGVNFWFPRLLGITASTVTAVFIFKISRRLFDHLAGILSTLLFGLTLTWKSTGSSFPAQTEAFTVLFIVLALWQIIILPRSAPKTSDSRGLILAGIFMGIALAFKQSAIFSVAALFFFYVDSTRQDFIPNKKIAKNTGLIAGGIIAATLLFLIPLFLSKITPADYFKSVWLLLLEKNTPTNVSFYSRIGGFIRLFKEGHILLFYPLLFLFGLQSKSLKKWGAPVVGLWGLIIMDFLAVNAAGNYANYQLKTWLPSISIASGITLSALFKYDWVSAADKPQRFVQLLMLLLILWVPIYPDPLVALKSLIFPRENDGQKYSLCQSPYPLPGDKDRKRLGLWVNVNTRPNDLVYVAGYGAQVQAYSERRSPTRHFTAMFIGVPGALREINNDLVNRSTKWILIPKSPQYRQWVSSEAREMISAIVARYYIYKTCVYGYDVYEKAG